MRHAIKQHNTSELKPEHLKDSVGRMKNLLVWWLTEELKKVTWVTFKNNVDESRKQQRLWKKKLFKLEFLYFIIQFYTLWGVEVGFHSHLCDY